MKRVGVQREVWPDAEWALSHAPPLRIDTQLFAALLPHALPALEGVIARHAGPAAAGGGDGGGGGDGDDDGGGSSSNSSSNSNSN